MSDNQYSSRYKPGDRVLLKSPTAKVLAVMFAVPQGGGPLQPFYTIMVDGNAQPMQGLPESEVIGRDYPGEQREKEFLSRHGVAGGGNKLAVATRDGLRTDADVDGSSPLSASPQAFGFADESQLRESMAAAAADDFGSEMETVTAHDANAVGAHALEGRADGDGLPDAETDAQLG